ncbi:K(+)-transporting ATPase subunit F [Enterobacterales bacterium CwR94]|nr:K(+)-transporting ATPase subunit F [Enterobacterales bacterium CwR94]
MPLTENLLERIVSAALIAGIVLVFLLLGYLVYALLNAEAF